MVIAGIKEAVRICNVCNDAIYKWIRQNWDLIGQAEPYAWQHDPAYKWYQGFEVEDGDLVIEYADPEEEHPEQCICHIYIPIMKLKDPIAYLKEKAKLLQKKHRQEKQQNLISLIISVFYRILRILKRKLKKRKRKLWQMVIGLSIADLSSLLKIANCIGKENLYIQDIMNYQDFLLLLK